MRINEIRAIIVYADITGFTSWSRRVRKIQVANVLKDSYHAYDRWAQLSGAWTKKQLDGFIGVLELHPTNDRQKIIQFLRTAHDVAVEMNRYLSKLFFPRPGLFRVRGVLGDCWKLIEPSGRVDYGGYQMIFGKRALDILKTEMFIVSEAVFDGVGRKGCHHMKMSSIKTPDLKLPGVEPEDQVIFYRCEFNRRPYKKIEGRTSR